MSPTETPETEAPDEVESETVEETPEVAEGDADGPVDPSDVALDRAFDARDPIFGPQTTQRWKIESIILDDAVYGKV